MDWCNKQSEVYKAFVKIELCKWFEVDLKKEQNDIFEFSLAKFVVSNVNSPELNPRRFS